MKRILKIIGFVLIAVICGVLQYTNVFEKVDAMCMDTLYQKERFINPHIKIVAIDEKTIEEYGHFGSWSRDVYARFVNMLNEQGKPAVIGLDILFSGEVDKQGDQALVDACQKYGNVFVVNNLVYKTQLIKENNVLIDVNHLHIENVEKPFSSLEAVTKQGYSNTVLDDDGYVRNHIPSVTYQQENFDSFAYAIAKSYSQGINQELKVPQTYGHQMFGIQYSAKNHVYEEVSLYDVLAGNVDLKSFQNSIVLLGAHAPGMQDAYNVPIEEGQQMYGVEIHANIIQALLDNKTYVPISRLIMALWVAIVCVIYSLIVYKISLWKSLICGVIIVLGYLWLGVMLFSQGYQLSLFVMIMSLMMIYIINIVYHYIQEFIRRHQTIELFKRYVSPEVVDQIVKQKDKHSYLEGEVKDVAVMFVDIRGFTTLSEHLSAKDIVEVLNHYFTLTSHYIFQNGGTLDKYIGDAIMAVFNSPVDLENYEFAAVKTALQISQEQENLSKFCQEKYGLSIGFGIGVHCGQVVVGNIGCERRYDFTAIGDSVNTASRIESIAKSGQVLISRAMYERVKDQVEVKELGKVRLKGKSQEVETFEVIGIKEGSSGE